MGFTKHAKLAVVREFAKARGLDLDDEIAAWEASFVSCDQAVAFGKGHQSIAACENPQEGHTSHFITNPRIGWADKHLSEQTWTRRSDGKVFRLAFSDYGWCD